MTRRALFSRPAAFGPYIFFDFLIDLIDFFLINLVFLFSCCCLHMGVEWVWGLIYTGCNDITPFPAAVPIRAPNSSRFCTDS